MLLHKAEKPSVEERLGDIHCMPVLTENVWGSTWENGMTLMTPVAPSFQRYRDISGVTHSEAISNLFN